MWLKRSKGLIMKHIAQITSEFLKEARDWKDMSIDQQRAYLKRHPKSKRRLTGKQRPDRQQKDLDKKERLEEAIVARKAFIGRLFKDLKGEKVEAYGKASHGFWGGSDEKQIYKISEVKLERGAKDQIEDEDEQYSYVDIRVYLDGYNQQFGLIYTDPKFLKSIRTVLKDKGYERPNDLDYTEQGMQGSKYVSMSMNFPKDIGKNWNKTKKD
jgi:hypothetical protein